MARIASAGVHGRLRHGGCALKPPYWRSS